MKNFKQLSVLKIKHPIFLYVSEEKGCASIIYEGCPKCFPELCTSIKFNGKCLSLWFILNFCMPKKIMKEEIYGRKK